MDLGIWMMGILEAIKHGNRDKTVLPGFPQLNNAIICRHMFPCQLQYDLLEERFILRLGICEDTRLFLSLRF